MTPDLLNYDVNGKFLYIITPFKNYKIGTNELEYKFLQFLLSKNVSDEIIIDLCKFKLINPDYFESLLKRNDENAIKYLNMMKITIDNIKTFNLNNKYNYIPKHNSLVEAYMSDLHKSNTYTPIITPEKTYYQEIEAKIGGRKVEKK